MPAPGPSPPSLLRPGRAAPITGHRPSFKPRPRQPDLRLLLSAREAPPAAAIALPSCSRASPSQLPAGSPARSAAGRSCGRPPSAPSPVPAVPSRARPSQKLRPASSRRRTSRRPHALACAAPSLLARRVRPRPRCSWPPSPSPRRPSSVAAACSCTSPPEPRLGASLPPARSTSARPPSAEPVATRAFRPSVLDTSWSWPSSSAPAPAVPRFLSSSTFRRTGCRPPMLVSVRRAPPRTDAEIFV